MSLTSQHDSKADFEAYDNDSYEYSDYDSYEYSDYETDEDTSPQQITDSSKPNNREANDVANALHKSLILSVYPRPGFSQCPLKDLPTDVQNQVLLFLDLYSLLRLEETSRAMRLATEQRWKSMANTITNLPFSTGNPRERMLRFHRSSQYARKLERDVRGKVNIMEMSAAVSAPHEFDFFVRITREGEALFERFHPHTASGRREDGSTRLVFLFDAEHNLSVSERDAAFFLDDLDDFYELVGLMGRWIDNMPGEQPQHRRAKRMHRRQLVIDQIRANRHRRQLVMHQRRTDHLVVTVVAMQKGSMSPPVHVQTTRVRPQPEDLREKRLTLRTFNLDERNHEWSL